MGSFFFSQLDETNPALTSNAGYRPPQWNRPQITSVTVPNTNSSVPAQSGVAAQGSVTYFFDAVLRADHSQELRSTAHPIQSGASIVDHSFLLPARLVLEIGMSDAMQSFSAGAYTSDSSKSVSAYKKLLEIQELRIPLKVATRLRLYENMVIENIVAPDDFRTRNSLRVSVYFQEIIVAQVTQNTISSRPNQTDTNTIGVVQPEPVPSDLNKYLSGTVWNSNQPNLPPSN